MGRVKSIAIKSLGNELLERYSGRFTKNFDENKKVLGEVCPMHSKKMRNVLAGYLVRELQLEGVIRTAPRRQEEN